MNIWNTFMCKWMNERIMEKVDVRLTEYEYARLKEYAKRHNQTLAQTLRLEVEKMIASL